MIAVMHGIIGGLLVGALSLLPDILPPGHQPVRHEMVVQGPLPQGLRLVAAPVRGFGGVHEVVPGEPFRFSSKYGTRLYQLPADAPVPGEWSRDWLQTMTHSSTFAEVASVPMGTPLARVVTTWRLAGVDGADLRLEQVAEQRLDGFGNPLPQGGDWWLLVAVAALGAGLVVWLWRSRREAWRC